MRDLQTQLTWYTRSRWTMGTAMALFLVAFYVFGYRTQIRQLRDLKMELAIKTEELNSGQNRAKALPLVELEVDRLKTHLDRLKKLPERPELASFLDGLGRLKQQYALRKWDYQPGTTRSLELFSELPISMTFEGDFPSVFAFLRQAEDMQRLTRVRSIWMKNKDAKLGLVEVRMDMSIYFSEG